MPFENIETRQELQAEFRRLAQVHHPDHGGDEKIMREIISEYKRLVKIIPDAQPEPVQEPAAETAPETAFFAPWRRTTAGGANPDLARLATPLYPHEMICTIAAALHRYTRQACDIRAFYRRICDQLDPGQSRGYQDYKFSPKIAARALQFLERKILVLQLQVIATS